MRWPVRSGVTAVVLALALAGCGGSGNTTSAVGSSSSGGGQPSGTLDVWTYVEGAYPKTQAQAFEAAHPGVKVKVTVVPGQDALHSRVLSAATTRTGPDLIVYNGAFTPKFAEAGAITALTPYWKSFDGASSFAPATIRKDGEEVWGAQAYVNLIALWYNEDILKAAGVQPPKTLDDLQAALEAVKKTGKKGIQLAGTPGIEGDWTAKPFFAGQGVDYQKIKDPKTAQVFSQVRDWVDKGYITKESIGTSAGDGVQLFLKGDTAFFVGGNWQLADARKAAKFGLGVTRMPAGPDGSIVYVGGETLSIGGFSKNPDLAWRFMQETWYSPASMVNGWKALGTIPSRSDALKNVAPDPALQAYQAAAQDAVALPSQTAATMAFGNAWSAVLAGQESPQQAATKLGDELPAALSQG